jgi:hypothetical protein
MFVTYTYNVAFLGLTLAMRCFWVNFKIKFSKSKFERYCPLPQAQWLPHIKTNVVPANQIFITEITT